LGARLPRAKAEAMRALDFSHTKISLSRSIWSYGKVQSLISALIRGRKMFMNFKTEGLILDLGCGPNSNPKNINLDYEWRPGIDICCDITKGLPLKDNYVGGIYTEHCVEHISFDAALFVFREFYRVLKPGAYVRIIVPDFEIYVDHYNLFRKTGELSMPYGRDDMRKDGIYSPVMSVNRIFRAHGHQFIYDFPTMAAMLEKVGLVEVKKARFGDGVNRSLILDTPTRAIESMYVEARKP
jgi:predicted SAM-dependent methyltransferase